MLETKIITTNLGRIDPENIDDYRAQGGFDALKKCLSELAPAQIVAEIKNAGLVGRGGAAFPTGLKWELGARAIERAKADAQITATAPTRADSLGYFVCNADESETGTFKDRVLIEQDPFHLIEALTIGARAMGASFGYIYLRGEYPLAYQRLRHAVEVARGQNLLGEKILGSDFNFDLQIRRGAGAYICGEETALFESIEGKRGEPRVKPPFPTDAGLFGKPTVINNVETLFNVPWVVLNGASEYRKLGTEKSPGTRVICLSGAINKAGVYEIAMGTPLRAVIDELGGGLNAGRKLQTVLMGGAAGSFIRPEQIDVALDFQSLNAIGSTFGSGAIMVLDDTADMGQVLKRLAHFFKHESCGKCFPCQLGTQRQLEIVERMAARRARAGDQQLLIELGQVMRDSSLCGLGQTAASAIVSAFEKQLVK